MMHFFNFRVVSFPYALITLVNNKVWLMTCVMLQTWIDVGLGLDIIFNFLADSSDFG